MLTVFISASSFRRSCSFMELHTSWIKPSHFPCNSMSSLYYDYEHPIPASHREVLRHRDAKYFALLESGTVTPFRYPFDTLGLGCLLLSVLFLPTIHARAKRYLCYVASCLVLCLSACTIKTARCQCLANGYGIGLATLWGVLWTGVLLIFNDPKSAFQRLERRRVKAVEISSDANQNFGDSHKHEEVVSESQLKTQYHWQPHPKRFGHRLDWTLDLVTSFRGPGWNWRLPSLPRLAKNDDGTPRSASSLLQPTIRAYIVRFLVFYMLIDALKIVMMHDPYFWGVVPLNSPAPHQYPSILANSKVLTKSFRLMISTLGVCGALEFISTLNPLFFGGFLVSFFPNVSKAPLNEPFLYPSLWGSVTDILDKGLPGFWGNWWHQMFR